MKKIVTQQRQFLADKDTPTGLFLRLREHFPEIILLESNDNQEKENSYSFLCFSPLIRIELAQKKLQISGLIERSTEVSIHHSLLDQMNEIQEEIRHSTSSEFFDINGLFGFTSFEAASYFDAGISSTSAPSPLPDLRYGFYKYILVFDHYHHTLRLLENLPEGDSSQLDQVIQHLQQPISPAYPFSTHGQEESPLTNEEFEQLVAQGKHHCARGDVFQLVVSRPFSQAFSGDAFHVYRSLRSINPSPYLFYYDYGNYAIMGSSPEAQLHIRRGKAQIHPIAGTFPRTGDVQKDSIAQEELMKDPKENAEHVMLVDLARNDLNRNTIDVRVSKYKTLESFSHVFHMVSIVEGTVTDEKESFTIFADTFPAGTLSGAPKIKALELIAQYENQPRSFYGGAIGYMALNGDLNHAIIIRSLVARENKLYYQAGAGVVIDSNEEKERKEVDHKLAAVRKAIAHAEHIKS